MKQTLILNEYCPPQAEVFKMKQYKQIELDKTVLITMNPTIIKTEKNERIIKNVITEINHLEYDNNNINREEDIYSNHHSNYNNNNNNNSIQRPP